MVESLPRPDLLIYLKASPTVLINRIRKRARNMETGITPDYLSLLDSFYDEFLGRYDSVLGVPEPGALVLLATGIFGLLAYAWRKRK